MDSKRLARQRSLALLLASTLLGLAAVPSVNGNERLDALSKRAMAAGARQDYPAAFAALREGSEAARAAGEMRRAALFENALSGMSFMAMDYSGALRASAEAIRIALQANELDIAGIAELNRSNYFLSLGDTASAETGLSRALSLLNANSPYKPIALTTLGTIESRRGQYDAARRTLTSAAVLAAASPDRIGEAFAYSALGALHMLTGRFDEAELAFLNNYRIRRLHRLPLLEGAWRQLA